MQQETRTPHIAVMDSKHHSGDATEMDLLDDMNEGVDPLDASKKASTKHDQRDMYRMGKTQELKV
jgi:hypothetical protein